MPFDVVQDIPTVTTDVTNVTSDIVSDVTTITNSLGRLMSSNPIPPLSLFSCLIEGETVAIRPPSFDFSTNAGSFPDPFGDFVAIPFTFDGDSCHLDLGIFGSLLKGLMTAVSTVIAGIINQLVSLVREAIKKFYIITDYLNKAWTWLKTDVINTLCVKFKNFYQELVDNKNNVEKNVIKTKITKAKKTLWERICIWYKEWWKNTVHPLITDLKNSVNKLFVDLNNAKTILWDNFVKLIEDIGKIPKDMNCLTKASTIITAA